MAERSGMTFRNRRQAGERLGPILEPYRKEDDVLVLALPRGGVPVAYEVAEHLDAPLRLFVVRKLGVPDQPELALGAIASGGARVYNQRIISTLDLSEEDIEAVVEREMAELARREEHYRGDTPAPDIAGRTVIVVDDGVATGATMRVAVQALRQEKAARIVVAVPTAAADTVEALQQEADDVVAAMTPANFTAVGAWYDDFTQTTDDEVVALLEAAYQRETEEQEVSS